jgi:hypothetical protein
LRLRSQVIEVLKGGAALRASGDLGPGDLHADETTFLQSLDDTTKASLLDGMLAAREQVVNLVERG